MPWRTSFAFLFLLLSEFCFGQQPARGSTAVISGLRGPVQSVLTENFTYANDGVKKPGRSERSIYDRSGYETELYEYEFRGLRSHTVYVRNDGHLVKTEITNPFSKQESVQIYNSDGFVTETDTYDGNGVLTSKTANDSSVSKEESTVSTRQATDGSISTIKQFADGSFKESTVKADGTTIEHAHYRASPPRLLLPVGHNIYGDWYQTSDASNRPLEFIEEPPTGKYLRISTHYDKAGQKIETVTYDHSGKLLSETNFVYLREDERGNWLEQQIWGRRRSKAAKLDHVIYRTITYYGSALDHDNTPQLLK